jgi:DNA-binding NarL/FixJ family response regulator
MINGQPDLVVCAEAGNHAQAMACIKERVPDVIVLDVTLQDGSGLELAKNINSLLPEVPILMLSMHDEALYAERALKAGARGYVMKDEPPDILLQAIRKVLTGEVYLSERMTARMLRSVAKGEAPDPELGGVERLSDRELEVFEMIGRGLATREIAYRLRVSIKTVETHCMRIKDKLSLRNATELMHRAVHWVHSLPSSGREA